MTTEGPGTTLDRGRCTTPDGVGVEVYDFGGSGTDLLLVHATGFCAEVFLPLAAHLASAFHCWGLDLRAHGRSGRPADGDLAWTGFAVDVLAVVDHLGLTAPSAFGHSCGGAAVLLAEEARPGTFRDLYCFEPVVIPGSPGDGPGGDNPLTAGARRRRETFPSREAALANFAGKPPLGGVDPLALRGYLDGGFELIPSDQGGDGSAVRLRCRRDDEAEVFDRGFFHDAYPRLGEVACPVTLGCGEAGDLFSPAVMEADARQLRDGRVEVFPGIGHFGPLEQPALVARSVTAALGRETSTGGGTPPS